MVFEKQNSNLRTEHNAQIKKIFDDILDENTPIFVKVEQFHYSSINNELPEFVELTVITELMYEYDKESILNPNRTLSVKNYRPYFASIIIPIDSREKISFFRKLEPHWNQATIQLKGGSYQAYIRCSCSAGPIKIYNRRIIIQQNDGRHFFNGKEINDLIKKDYDPNQLNMCIEKVAQISKELNSVWEKNRYCYIDIYNIGHGNADYIVGNKKRILYDIGYPYRHTPNCSSTVFPKAMKAFGMLRPNLVIISHWDADHYMGCVYASDHIFDVNWIAPTLTSNNDKSFSLNSFRLCAFLKSIGKLKFVDRAQSGTFKATDNKGELIIHMGDSKARETSGISMRNREGLYLEIVNKNEEITILAGDVPYNSMDSSIFAKNLTFLHVPHHGSKMNLNSLSQSKWGKIAIVTTDKDSACKKYDIDVVHNKELLKKFNQNVYFTIGNLSGDKYYTRVIRLYGDGTCKPL